MDNSPIAYQKELLNKIRFLTTTQRRKINHHRALSIGIGSICKNAPEASKITEDSDINYVSYLIEISIQITNEIDELNKEINNILFEIESGKN